MYKLVIAGSNGRMGHTLVSICNQFAQFALVAKIIGSTGITSDSITFRSLTECVDKTDAIDVVIDFSTPNSSIEFATSCAKNGIAYVCGTTGFTDYQLAELARLSTITPIFHAPNMSIGIHAMKLLAQKASQLLDNSFDIEVLEMHHSRKEDSPSGTALMLAQAIATAQNDTNINTHRPLNQKRQKGEIGIASLRGGGVHGEHTVFFLSEDEQLAINHKSSNKNIFAIGAFKAATWLMNQTPGKLYGMDDLYNFN